MLNRYFADLHIHVGMSENGKWVKIPTSRRLTVKGIVAEAAGRKGMNIIGIIDALSPLVLDDIKAMVEEGLLALANGGGYLYKDNLLLILGAEIETREKGGGLAHTLVFLQDINKMAAFSECMSSFIRNISLSSQNAHMPLGDLINIADSFGGLIVPAHVFTPHKGLIGACTDRLAHILTYRQMDKIAAIELGLSADSDMADRLGELTRYSFITNSDAHSLEKIAREYNIFALKALSFDEIAFALSCKEGRHVAANYGLHPRLGKYHRSLCTGCGYIDLAGKAAEPCPECGGHDFVKGVFDRINEIADFNEPQHPPFRPPYFYQIPLEFVPGLGPKLMNKLLAEFGTEMNILHYASFGRLVATAGSKVADCIMSARAGTAVITDGGGGIYGRMVKM